MGDAGMDAYAQISPDGMVGQKIPFQGIHKGMPYARMKMDLHGVPPEEAGKRIAQLTTGDRPAFYFVRTILASPTLHQNTMKAALQHDPQIEFVDPYTFFTLMKAFENQPAEAAKEILSEVRFESGGSDNTLFPILIADGKYERAERDGVQVLRTPPGPHRYLYFRATSAFCRPFRNTPKNTVTTEVRVFDAEPGWLLLQYDSHHNTAYQQTVKQEMTGTGKWLTLRFELDGALFAHGQNGGADLRLARSNAALDVAGVVLRKK
jgi:hypothetical protein